MRIALGIGCRFVEFGCAGRGFDVADQSLPCAPLSVAENREGERKGAAQALCEVMCREGQSCRSKRVLTYDQRFLSENLEPEVSFFEDIQVCPSTAAGTDTLEDCHIRQAERAGTKMEARRGKIAIENGWLDSRQLARRACQKPVCRNKPSD